jgi:SAM-dependent methyltransferase
MQEESYDALHELEYTHWWYRGARHAYRTLIGALFGKPARPLRMLEVGCGSGGNLELLGEYGPTAGAELSLRALGMVEQRPQLGLVQASATALPFASASFDGVHMWSLIEHLDDDVLALSEARRVCRPDGGVTILTSAVPLLWSHHDAANLHRRRYMRKGLEATLRRAGLQPLRLSYQTFFVFPLVLVVRLWQRRAEKEPARYDMGSPPGWANRFLLQLSILEAWLIRFVSLPIGVDLVAACRPFRQEQE